MHPTYMYTRVLLGLQIHVHVQCHVLLVLGMTSMNFLATAKGSIEHGCIAYPGPE